MKMISNFKLFFLCLALFSCTEKGVTPSGSSSSGGSSNSGGSSGGSSGLDTTGLDSGSPQIAGRWLIPQSEVLDGGPGKDGIPALSDPQMVLEGDDGISYLEDDDLVIAIKRGDEVHAFPHAILDWHEIINTSLGGDDIAVTYCPLTGTALGWNRNVNNQVTTFGVSGLLYNSNLIPYDRATDSHYSQIFNISVNGDNIGVRPELFPLLETTWGILKKWYPNALVTSSNTGHDRRYGGYPYGDYKTSLGLLFPISNSDDRLHSKERVLGVLNDDGDVRAYRSNLFETRTIIIDQIYRDKVIVIGDKTENWIASYRLPEINSEELTLTILNDQGEAVMQDQFGNRWNAFGEAVSGPNQGFVMSSFTSFIGYWFSWFAFYPFIEVYGE